MYKETKQLYVISWKRAYTEWIAAREIAEETKLQSSGLKEAKELIDRIRKL